MFRTSELHIPKFETNRQVLKAKALSTYYDSIDPFEGLILNSGCSMSANTNPENIDVWLEAYGECKIKIF